MSTSTSIKLAIAGIIAIVFAGFVLRAAVKLANAAMHSFLVLALVLIVVIWLSAKIKK